MAEAARGDDADLDVLRIALDRPAYRLAERIATARRRLVGRIIGVERQRHDRQRLGLVHQLAVDEAEGMALALAVAHLVGGGERSEERRVGTECGSALRYRGLPYH